MFIRNFFSILDMELVWCGRIVGGAVPANKYSLCTGVGLRHPVMILAISFTAWSMTFLHTGPAYSAAEMLRRA
jgi:hypothetical protein